MTEGEKLVWAAVYAQRMSEPMIKAYDPNDDDWADYRVLNAISHAEQAVLSLRRVESKTGLQSMYREFIK